MSKQRVAELAEFMLDGAPSAHALVVAGRQAPATLTCRRKGPLTCLSWQTHAPYLCCVWGRLSVIVEETDWPAGAVVLVLVLLVGGLLLAILD